MPVRPYSLELCFAQGDYGLSARRLREFTELGQINVFSRAISERSELNDAADFVDVIHFDGDAFSLVGCTLADLRVGRLPVNSRVQRDGVLNDLAETDYANDFIREVQIHLDRCSDRQAVRNQHQPFLPTAKADDVFGVPSVYSTLQQRLQSMGTPCNLGGHRVWWQCPAAGCRRRVAVLYGGSGIFACRHCYWLAYRSQRESESYYRPADKLRARLGWVPGIAHGEGGKPRGMHWKTYERLTASYYNHVNRALAGMSAKLGLTMARLDRINRTTAHLGVRRGGK